MADLRKVEISKHVCRINGLNGKQEWDLEPDYIGRFHAWGVQCEELELGVGNYTCAVVEKDDGTVDTPAAFLVRFMDKKGGEIE